MSNRGSKKKKNHQNLTLKMMITSNQVNKGHETDIFPVWQKLTHMRICLEANLGWTQRSKLLAAGFPVHWPYVSSKVFPKLF